MMERTAQLGRVKASDEEGSRDMTSDVPPYPDNNTTSGRYDISDDTLHERNPQDASIQGQDHDRIPSQIIVSFSSTDPEAPNNWPFHKKFIIFGGGIMSVLNSTLGSSMPSGAAQEIAAHFHVTSEIQMVLPISTFLIGYIVGPIICGPLSEHYGRKIVFLVAFLSYTLFTLATALAPNWPAFLFFRFVCGCFASAPIAVLGGLYADIFTNPRSRGVAMACFMAATTFGPVLGPIISGFSAPVSWRWPFWILLIFAGTTIPFILIMPESYAPVLLARKAAKMRKETGNQNIVARSELESKSMSYVLSVVMTRPFRMLIHESIVLFTCMYISLAFAIFYLYFEAYPIIFQGPNSIYHFNAGETGLAFLPIGIGAAMSSLIFLLYDSYLARAQARKAPWSQVEEYRRLPLACIGGPLYVVSLLWIAWSAKPDVHWIVPILSGITFGMGFLLIFMAMLNYLTDAYETFAASAQGIASTCRSLGGALLPLGSKSMFDALGVHWACSLLAFLSLGMAIIPFAFIKYGDRIRANSKFCQELKALKAQEQKHEAEEEEGRRMSARNSLVYLQEDKGLAAGISKDEV